MASDEFQAIEGYGCSCGFKVQDLGDFRRHLLDGVRQHKQNPNTPIHKSIGRVNMQSGDIVLPPYEERTNEEKAATNFGLKKEAKGEGSYLAHLAKKEEKAEAGEDDEVAEKRKKADESARQTTDANNAVGVKVVPRVLTINYTNIMRTAQVAAIREWKWRPDMSLENFLDTCLANFFKEHGITLGGYFKEEEKKDGDGHAEIAELREMLMETMGQVRGLTQIVHELIPAG